MYSEWKNGELLVSTDPAKLDIGAAHAFLTRSYWAEEFREIYERSLRNSLCFQAVLT